MNAAAPREPELIKVPPHPVLAFGMRLATDEACAWVVSAVATGLLGWVLLTFAPDLATVWRTPLLAVVGPVAEKLGLFASHFYKAFREYRQAPPAARRPWGHYLRQVWRSGAPSLRADIMFHDPVYMILVGVLLTATGTASAVVQGLLAAVCFVTAIAVASGLEVLCVDLRYWYFQRRLRGAGFRIKSYYEAHFRIDPEGDPDFAPEAVFARLREHFGLPTTDRHHYRDRYLTAHRLPERNGRKPAMRFRQRRDADGSISKQALQVMYTRAREVDSPGPSPYRCFAALKDKAGYDWPVDADMPWTIADLEDPALRRFVRRLADPESTDDREFDRFAAKADAGIFLSVDVADAARPGAPYNIEIKVLQTDDAEADVARLRAASDYITWKLPVRPTTRSRYDWQLGN